MNGRLIIFHKNGRYLLNDVNPKDAEGIIDDWVAGLHVEITTEQDGRTVCFAPKAIYSIEFEEGRGATGEE